MANPSILNIPISEYFGTRSAEAWVMENMIATAASIRPVLTHCAICHAALTDAASVEIGIGPVCRKRCDYDSIPANLRERANALIARVSLNLKDPAEVRFCADELRTMGLDKLAACLLDRFAVIFLRETETEVAALCPYKIEFNANARVANALWSWNTRSFRYFKRGRGAWTLPKSSASKNAFWAALVTAFPGMIVKIVGQHVPVWLEGTTMPSLAADPSEPEKTANDHAREIRAALKALDFGGRKARFDAFAFSLAAANAGYDVSMFLANPTRAIREHAADASKVLDAKPSRRRASSTH